MPSLFISGLSNACALNGAQKSNTSISKADEGKSVAIDNNDNIYVAGTTEGALDGNTNVGGADIFLTKWSADGTKQWTKQWGTSKGAVGAAIAIDSNENIYVTGWTGTGGAFDGNTNAGSFDIFLSKLSNDGTKQWTEQWGTSGSDLGLSVAIAGNDNIYVTGYATGALDGNTYAGNTDIFLTKWKQVLKVRRSATCDAQAVNANFFYPLSDGQLLF